MNEAYLTLTNFIKNGEARPCKVCYKYPEAHVGEGEKAYLSHKCLNFDLVSYQETQPKIKNLISFWNRDYSVESTSEMFYIQGYRAGQENMANELIDRIKEYK